jgi:preprotein translocase subunit SecA
MNWILKKIVGTKNERDLKRIRPLIARIDELEAGYQSLTDEQLKAKTGEFRERLAKGGTLDDLLCEAFAAVKCACRRLCGTTIDVCGRPLKWEMVPFDVQMIGGISLHQGKIAEMATGEGKTLVATLPVYLNALTGKGVHVVTVNDYLARRDAQWMGSLYTWLGLTVGCIQNAMEPAERRRMYECDITYGTNAEFGFDYLRDNMALRSADQVQPGHQFAIVDEIDSILIDEARTPLIISGPAPYSTKQYVELRPAVDRLVRRQREICNNLAQEAKDLLEKENRTKEDEETAAPKLYQVGQGMPKHKQFLRLMEDAAIRRIYEKVDSSMLTDMHKEEARELREELYFTIDEKGNDASLTEKGCAALNPDDPEMYVLPDLAAELAILDGDASLTLDEKLARRQKMQDVFADRNERIHAVDQLIRAYSVYERDVQYVIQENQIVIVDEFTGRLMPGRRWSDGLHQAIEAKEGVKVERETQTLATITIQNYFRMYKKLAGMTGTAETEADEFHQIYKLDVVVMPTNRPVRRVDQNDRVYKTQREKYNAVIDEIALRYEAKQPVLVGTVTVEHSEIVSRMLRRRGIPHNVLNAKNHEREAEIVSRAGEPGAVTIATNMAGRGTDIKLGEGVVWLPRDVITSQIRLADAYEGTPLRKLLLDKPCGLHVLGSERHEARRIDRQLRGRCARQGDPGSSTFFVSLEDDLMRLFGSDRISRIMERLGIEEGEVLEHPWLNRSIETAQRRVEQQNFSIRKRTLEYDDVMNTQRTIIYGFRGEVLRADDVRAYLMDIVEDVVSTHAEPAAEGGEDGMRDFLQWVDMTFPLGMTPAQLPSPATAEGLTSAVMERIRAAYDLKAKMEDAVELAELERQMILFAIDNHWQEYLRGMDALRQGVGLRAYGQRDPLVEYKREAYDLFADLMDKIKMDVATRMFRSSTSLESFERMLRALPQSFVHAQVQTLGGDAPSAGAASEPAAPSGEDAAMQAALRAPAVPIRNEGPKVGRNDPCPCGSGKKYKKCHGASPG